MAARAALQQAEGGAEVLELLDRHDQLHLLKEWEAAATDTAAVDEFIQQVAHLNGNYPGGLAGYIKQAKELLHSSAVGANPFEGMAPEIPEGNKLIFGSSEFLNFESIGLGQLDKLAFVLVAGGLGERLGYNGIKVSLPTEITTGKCYLQLYIETILACQAEATRRHGRPVQLRFAIMTSGDTHEKTEALLRENAYFGLMASQITLMKQEKVACLIDNDARLASAARPWSLLTKPHGHGDVHYLLHSLGVAQKWQSEGFEWMVFFQDTNSLVFRAVIAALGVSATEKFAVNSIAGPRQAKREMGAIVKLRRPDGTTFTNNVEYNQLDALLRGSGIYPDGDAPDKDGLSPFPGNMNQLLFHLPTYTKVVGKTKGLVPEFVNPKYADESRQQFKKPTRLECMMQDLPRLFKDGERVGFTTLTGNGMRSDVRSALGKSGLYNQSTAVHLDSGVNFYSPVKNNKVEASKKQKKGVAPSCASEGEANLHAANCKLLLALGVRVHPPRRVRIGVAPADISIDDWPHVILAPTHCLSLSHAAAVFPKPGAVEITSRSTLVIDGPGKVIIEELKLDGALTIKCTNPNGLVRISGFTVSNAGLAFEEVDDKEEDEVLRIRGYRLRTSGLEVIEHGSANELVVCDPVSSRWTVALAILATAGILHSMLGRR